MSYSHEYNAIESLIGCAYHEAALKMHLADSELCILYTLHTHGPGCLQSTLYKETGLTKTTVNSALKKLEKGGTLYLTPGPGRNTRVYLTESGAQLARDTAGRLMELENRIYASWTPEEQALFLRLNLIPICKPIQIPVRKIIRKRQIQVGRIKLFIDLLV